jgi:hypothetical protein
MALVLLPDSAEQELQRLQRQYRIMEGDRKAYSEESRIMLKKQRFFQITQRDHRKAQKRQCEPRK